MRRYLPVAALVLVFFSSCDRPEECDNALDVVCSCESIDCSDDTADEVVRAFRDCDDDVFERFSFNWGVCVDEAGPQYCQILDGLRSSSSEVCSASCVSHACDLRDQCHSFQFEMCDTGGLR